MDIEKSLKLTYEIEGLLYLLKENGITQEKRATVQSHIADKVAQLSELASCSEVSPDIEDSHNSPALPDDSKTADEKMFSHSAFIHNEMPVFEEIRHENMLEHEVADEMAEMKEEMHNDDMSQSDVSTTAFSIGDDAEDESEKFVSEAEAHIPVEYADDETADDKAIAANALREEAEDAAGNPPIDTPDSEEPSGNEPEHKIKAEAAQDPQPTPDKRQDVNIMARRRNMGESLRSSFTLNDKFRFRRELFGNSDIEMSNAINLIEAMSSPDEAEEYFIGELGWDKTNDEVKDFMEIIDNYLSGK